MPVSNWLSQAVEISSIELREAMSPSVNIIVDTVRDCLDDTPPELVADFLATLLGCFIDWGLLIPLTPWLVFLAVVLVLAILYSDLPNGSA